ncbi:Baseplate protein J-like [uncultured Caudovirales phage]|uniref:Baseplate protein J-like n=1 Tax=uncultured Caudovirales phage TaxID=2100421 RepID=A0A6J5RFD5_9CAUD|nr:Baseplate protein J-like [uncultured Caudovirales phage]
MTTSNIDTTGYVDLTLFDTSAQDVYNNALSYATWVMPDWEPAETNTENVIMQAIALMISEGQYTMNRIPNAVVEVIMQLYGITRVTGDYPTVTVTFTTVDATGYTIPAGTEILYDLGDGGDPIVFSLNSNVVIAAGLTTGTGVMTGSLAESRFNNIPAGTFFTVVTPLSFLLSVKSTTLITGGADSESDAAYFDRGMLRLARLTETLIRPSNFEAYTVEFDTTIYRAKCIDRYNPTGGTPGTNNGYVTVAVYGNGVPVSATVKASLLTALRAAAMSSLTITVIDPETINLVGIHATVVPLASYGNEATLAAVNTALRAYLSTATWPWATTLRWSNIVGVIENAAGVDYITTLNIALNKIVWNQSLFYTDITAWAGTTNCSAAWSSTISHSSVGGSLAISPTAAGNLVATAGPSPAYVAAASKTYWVSGFVYVPANQAARTCRIGVSWYNASSALITTGNESIGVLTIAGTWVEIGVQLTSPALTAKATVYIEVDATGSAAERFYFDEINLSEYQTVNTDVTLVGNGPLVMPAEIVLATA